MRDMRVKVFAFVVYLLSSVASSAAATSTIPREVNATALPELCLTWTSPPDAPNPRTWTLQECSKTAPTAPNLLDARGKYNASLYDLGWDYLEVTSDADGKGNDGSYNIGFLEGFLTSDRIKYLLGVELPPSFLKWLDEHIAWIQGKVAENAAGGPGKESNPYWTEVGKLLAQLQGLSDGYNAKVQNHSASCMRDFFIMNFGPEFGDVAIALQVQQGTLPRWNHLLPPRRAGSHCSALIKPTADDLFVSHDTWSGYSGMSGRIFKVYKLFTSVSGTKSPRRVSFSAYPGTIASGDDWYKLLNADNSVSMVVQETTNEVFNTTLYLSVHPQSVSEFLRVMVANWIATSGEEWTELFSTHNSGTYNNQYMVVDFLRYAPQSTIPRGTLWIAEQIPGYIARQDVSDILDPIRGQGYWASYNIPYDRYVFDVSGYAEMVKRQGSFWSYTKYARPEIFRRNNTDVRDISTMMRMMRYNNYQVDEYSLIPNCTGAGNGTNICNPDHSSMLTVASRGDLMKMFKSKEEMIYHYGVLYDDMAQGCFGAIDSKIGSWKNRYNMNSWAISGPTNDQHPTFSYDTSVNCKKVPAGSPVTFDFPWLELIPDL